MRIAQLVSLKKNVPPKGYHNGVETMVSDLTEELVKRGHRVTLFAPAGSKTKAKLVSLYPYSLAEKGFWNQPDIKAAFIEENLALCFSQEENFDLIHSHIGDTAAKFVPLVKIPVVHTLHSPVTSEFRRKVFPSPKYNKYKKKYFSYLRDKKNCFVFISKFQKKESPISKRQQFVIYNGIKIQNFEFNNNPKNYFAFLGAINFDKGAYPAVKVAKRLKIKLKLAGNLDKEYYKKYIKPELKSKFIEYVGVVNKKQRSDFLKNARALLFPIQWEEPFGLVMIEAMACGTPVIGFRRGSVPEIVKDGKTGFVVDNLNQMIRAVEKIDQIDRRECRKYVEKNFTVEKMVDEYERVYQEVIKTNFVYKQIQS